MKLTDYRKSRGMTVAALARDLGKPHETIRRWENGDAVPRKREVERIFAWSGGEVRPEDWYELPGKAAGAQPAAAGAGAQ
jgi:transcriptional regulator with XRE-family HTH domain